MSAGTAGAGEGRPPVFDSHCHLQDEPDPFPAWQRAQEAGVTGLICVGTDVESSERAVEVARLLGPRAWATAGLHPHDSSRRGSEGVDGLAGLVESPEVVAVGECGLDYHYDHSPRADQRAAFAAQAAMARDAGKTLVVHSREAWADTLDVLRAEAPGRVVLHCFTGGPDEARACLDLGAWLSFSGIVTFASAAEIREAVALCPPDRVLVETDSPYLTPVPHRGRRNEPAMARLVAEAVSLARSETLEELSPRILANTAAAFDLGPL
ncbi:MAG: TatD family hydrolase [Acidimicrobiales bacterium]